MKNRDKGGQESYVAFLRGINVGGNKLLKMDVLRQALESLGLADVKTLLASGNALFEGPKGDLASVSREIEEGLEKALGKKVGVILRTKNQIREIFEANPFAEITVTPETRLYVTFLGETPQKKPGIPIPYESEDGDFRILQATDTEVFSVLVLTPRQRTVDAMKVIEQEFGKKVTTRNWNTVAKVAK